MKIKTEDLFSTIPQLLFPLFDGCRYPWEALMELGARLTMLVASPPKGYTLFSEGVLVGAGVMIEEGATIIPPAIICHNAKIRQGAYLRGSVFVGNSAIIGHSTEVKNSILMDGAKAPHFNYVGDSILGNNVHLGAGVILSNLRLDKGEVFAKFKSERMATGKRKLGAIIGDDTEIGCNSVLSPGTVLTPKR